MPLVLHPVFAARDSADSIPIRFVTLATWPALRDTLDAGARRFADTAGFEPKAGRHLLLPGADGRIDSVLFAIDAVTANPFQSGVLPSVLPHGTYRFADGGADTRLAALGFALGAYCFTRYRRAEDRPVRIVLPDGVDGHELNRIVEAVTLARDLINTPSNDMGPAEIDEATHALATRHRAKVRVVTGDDLLSENFPLVHAVGRAAAPARAPRLIDLQWGDANAPKVTLVGKGVCFDTGGLDIKSDNSMLLMKKDMGGAATMLALAHMIMDRKLKVRLRVLIPAVENAISGSAIRPLDVYRSRKGLTIEIGNTDAEGRLILADALALADEEKPDLLIDMGTLTGAARIALGPDLPPFYTDDDALAVDVARFCEQENDPAWRLPLWRRYDSMLDSKIGDLNNVSSGSFAGSITCALFLKRFVESAKAWLHFDIYAWNPSTMPARPEGGECQAARAVYALLSSRYG